MSTEETKPLPFFYQSLNAEDKQAFDIIYKLFKNDYGEPFEMTPGQISLFRAIYEKQDPRIQFDCYTQYGKSDVVSMAVLLRCATFQEKWILLGATKDKAGIIMGKLIKHIFENDYTLGKFQIDENESLDFIRRNRSKDNITFKVDENGIGQVITLSADARRKSEDAGDILIGHGGQNLIIDDAALIQDKIYNKALRMLGGHKENFMLKITNSFGRNHAWRSRNDPRFRKFIIDYKQGLKEGRLTEEFMSEVKESYKNDPVMFGILYECVYPPSNLIDEKGWAALLTPEEVEEAQKRSLQSDGIKKMGVDVAEGTNLNAYVIRTSNFAFVKETNQEPDPMKTADKIVVVAGEERIAPQNITVDASGGAGVYSRLKQMDFAANSFKGGESPTELTEVEKKLNPTEFANLRAECFWKLRQWVLKGGALSVHEGWKQLSLIKWRNRDDKKIMIMSKEEMRARGYLSASQSTDVPDAMSMTFAENVIKFNMNAVASTPVRPFYPDIDGGGHTPQPQQSESNFSHDLR